MQPSERARPGRWWYFVAVLVLVGGMALFAQTLFSLLNELGAELRQLVVPGTHDLALGEAGEYTIFHERVSVVNGEAFSGPISGLRVTVTGPGGEALPVSSPGTSMTYSFGGRSGAAIFGFRIERAGTYRLSAVYADGRAEPRAVLTVARDFMGKLIRTILSGLGIAFGTILLAVGIVLVTFFKRRA
jgi:hypothetical protein